jgi:hypothetical protein
VAIANMFFRSAIENGSKKTNEKIQRGLPLIKNQILTNLLIFNFIQ